MTFRWMPAESRKVCASKASGDAGSDLRVNTGFVIIRSIYSGTVPRAGKQDTFLSIIEEAIDIRYRTAVQNRTGPFFTGKGRAFIPLTN